VVTILEENRHWLSVEKRNVKCKYMRLYQHIANWCTWVNIWWLGTML